MYKTKRGKGEENLSLKQIHKGLISLGLSNTDAKVYIFLSIKALQKVTDIAEALRMSNQRLYPCLKKLQDRGIVNCTSAYPKLFAAVPIEEALRACINANLEEAQTLEENKQKILSFWQAMINKNSTQTN